MTNKRNLLRIISIVLLYILCIILSLIVINNYDEGIIYDGVKPYVWGETVSVSFFSIGMNFCKIIIIGCMIAILKLIHILRNKQITTQKNVYISCGIINAIAVFYISFVMVKNDSVIYHINEPILNDNGVEINMLQVLGLPIILVSLIMLLTIIFIIFDTKLTHKE